MIKVRLGVFETNSSSTHVLVLCPKKTYKNFIDGELYLDTNNETLVTKEEIAKKYEDRGYTTFSLEEYIEENFETYEQHMESEFENFYKEYKTPGGETIVAFGVYGNDY